MHKRYNTRACTSQHHFSGLYRVAYAYIELFLFLCRVLSHTSRPWKRVVLTMLQHCTLHLACFLPGTSQVKSAAAAPQRAAVHSWYFLGTQPGTHTDFLQYLTMPACCTGPRLYIFYAPWSPQLIWDRPLCHRVFSNIFTTNNPLE